MPDIAEMEWTAERVQRFWDHESRYPHRYFTYTRAGSLVARVKPFLKNAKQFIDYGCGRGYLTEQLLALDVEVTAADYSPDSVAFVAERYSGQSNFRGAYVVADLEARGITRAVGNDLPV